MISYIITFLIFGWLITEVINQIKSTKKFNTEVESMSISVEKLIISNGIVDMEEILDDPEYFEHKLKEQVKAKTHKIFTSLSDIKINPSNFDLVHKKVTRFFSIPFHKHEKSNIYVHVLQGSLDIFVECSEEKDPKLSVKKVSLKKDQSFYIPASCYHKLVSKWGAEIILLFIPSLSYVESSCTL